MAIPIIVVTGSTIDARGLRGRSARTKLTKIRHLHAHMPLRLLLAALTMFGLQACKPATRAGDPRSQARLVRLATVEPARSSERRFTGLVMARVQSDLGFRVAGKVVERLVDVGQTVRVGQVLMRLDRTDLAHAVAAQAGAVAAARARWVQAAAEEARTRSLVPSGAASRSQYDQARAAADSARAMMEAAEAQARVIENEGAYSSLLADADGTVVATLAEPGQVISAGQPVLGLAHAGAREAAVDLPEDLRPAIGTPARASLYGAAGQEGPAKLRQIAGSADPRTRTFDARYVLGGSLEHAPLGASVVLLVAGDQPAEGDAIIPLSALDDGGGGPGVWVFDARTSEVGFRPVQVRQLGDEQATLDDGVRPGERIVALGVRLLHEGERVRTETDQASLP